VDVVVRNIAPYGARMRWADPTTPGNLTKIVQGGCTSCGPKAPSLAGAALRGFRGLGALDESIRALPSGQGDLQAAEHYDAISAERDANQTRAAVRLVGAAGLYSLLSVGVGIAGFVHGYNRNRKSAGWGLAWGAFGFFFSPLALGWMLGQKSKRK
jgi:hypothetical protein